MNGRSTPRLVSAVLLSAALVGCSSSGSSSTPPASSAPSGTPATTAADQAQAYLDAVNSLCDALLPKIVKATRGGSFDVPAREYLATWPAHRRLEVGFDASIAAVPVPAAANDDAAALRSYVRFADRLDAARLAAARKGQTAYAQEVRSESGVENDPTIAALTAAGFNESCTAR